MKKLQSLQKTALAVFISSALASGSFANVFNPAIPGGTQGNVFEHLSPYPYVSSVNVTDKFNEHNAFSLEKGTVTFHFKQTKRNDMVALLGVSDTTQHNNYVVFYSHIDNNQNNKFGVELRTGTNTRLIPNDQLLTAATPIGSDPYKTVTYVFDKDNRHIKIYVNGALQKTFTGDTKFFNDLANLTMAQVGRTHRAPSANASGKQWSFQGDLYYAALTPSVLSEAEILAQHNALVAARTAVTPYVQAKSTGLGQFRSPAFEIFKPITTSNPANNAASYNSDYAASYRIPALWTTVDKQVVIAAIDKRRYHAGDWGDIDTAIRRSFDGGQTWQNEQVILNLAQQPYAGSGAANSGTHAFAAALLIDPLLTQDKNSGRLFMLVDMFPESQAFFGMGTNSHRVGTGYAKVGDKDYRFLTERSTGHRYTVREGGAVYNSNGDLTKWRVVVEGDPSKGYHDLGDLYDTTTNTRHGNIFLNSTQSGHDSAPLSTHVTAYLWLTHSDNNGETWTNPVDITPQVKADWMMFIGTGPGVGIQLKNGNLMLPIYYTNQFGKQSAAVIVSEDNGITWKRGESPTDSYLRAVGGSKTLNHSDYETTESQIVELNNGQIKMFSRNMMGNVLISTSYDGGMTWEKNEKISDQTLLDPYSQMSVIKYSKLIEGKEYVVFANPHSSRSDGRQNGVVWLGEVQEDGEILWKYNTTITSGRYAYNSLTELPNGDIGLIYEENQGTNLKYLSFNIQELVWTKNRIYRDSRTTDDRKSVTLNTDQDETYYKIGDGEMIKVGTGVNAAKLVVEEGLATLRQEADGSGAKQAYSEVTVNENGTVRLTDLAQVALTHLHLNHGTADLYGNDLTLNDHTATTGLYANPLTGNFINDGARDITVRYELNGARTIQGYVGHTDSQHQIDFVYAPTNPAATLRIEGDTILNQLDVASGALTLANDSYHTATQAQVASNAKLLLENSVLLVDNLNLAASSQFIAHADVDNSAVIEASTIQGAGQVQKTGKGLVKVTGNLSHTGGTFVKSGAMALDGTLRGSDLIVGSGATFGGNADVQAKAVWQNNSRITPAVADNNAAFAAYQLRFNNVVNEGATVLLRVNNSNNEIESWQHDQLLVRGDVEGQPAIPVDVQFLGTGQGQSDTNHNGRYDANEGISLLQILGNAALNQFVLGQTLDQQQNPSSLFQYALVAVDKGVSEAKDNRFGTNDSQFYDYRLQTRLIDAQGNSPEPVVRNRTAHGSSTTAKPNPELDLLEVFAQELKQKEQALVAALAKLEAAQAAEAAAHNLRVTEVSDARADLARENAAKQQLAEALATKTKQAEAELAQKAQEIADLKAQLAQLDVVKDAQKAAELKAKLAEAEAANNAKQIADLKAQLALFDAVKNAQQAAELKAKLAEAEAANNAKQIAELKAQLAQLDAAQKAQKAAELKLKLAETETAKNEQEIANLKAQLAALNLAAQNADNQAYRAALEARIPSYLVANTAVYHQGEALRQQFMANLWTTDTKGLYVNYQDGNTRYQSNRNFAEYGYGYKAKQSSTLIGGYVPLSETASLHAGVGFSKQTVTPEAADGWSETHYKTTSLLMALQNKWQNGVIWNAGVGYHIHKGRVATASNANVATINAKQWQVATDLGYEIPLGQFSLTPLVGLGYQQVDMQVDNHLGGNWDVSIKPYNVFSQRIGSYLSWKNDVARLNIGTFYEHNNDQTASVTIRANETAQFETSRLGNAILFNASGEFAVTKQLSLELRLEHRKGLSDAKLKQTRLGGKLEYQF